MAGQLPSVTRSVLALLLNIAGSLFIGCAGPGPITIKDWYSPPNISALPQRETIAVFQFDDKRGVADGKLIGQAFSKFGDAGVRRSSEIYVDEPIAIAVTRAFVEGFRARGFPVVDRTAATFTLHEFETEAKVAVSGDIVMFQVEEMAWAPSGLDTAAGARPESGIHVSCAVLLHAQDIKSGRKLWQKEYRKDFERTSWRKVPERGPRNKTPIGQVLAEVVEEVVYDPGFTLALRGISPQ
jgi:hypothetical protein